MAGATQFDPSSFLASTNQDGTPKPTSAAKSSFDPALFLSSTNADGSAKEKPTGVIERAVKNLPSSLVRNSPLNNNPGGMYSGEVIQPLTEEQKRDPRNKFERDFDSIKAVASHPIDSFKEMFAQDPVGAIQLIAQPGEALTSAAIDHAPELEAAAKAVTSKPVLTRAAGMATGAALGTAAHEMGLPGSGLLPQLVGAYAGLGKGGFTQLLSDLASEYKKHLPDTPDPQIMPQVYRPSGSEKADLAIPGRPPADFSPTPTSLPPRQVQPQPAPAGFVPPNAPAKPLWQGIVGNPEAPESAPFVPEPGKLPSGRVPGKPAIDSTTGDVVSNVGDGQFATSVPDVPKIKVAPIKKKTPNPSEPVSPASPTASDEAKGLHGGVENTPVKNTDTPQPAPAQHTTINRANAPSSIEAPSGASVFEKPRIMTEEAVTKHAADNGVSFDDAKKQLTDDGYSIMGRSQLNRALHAVGSELGLDHDAVSAVVRTPYEHKGYDSMTQMSQEEMLSELNGLMEKRAVKAPLVPKIGQKVRLSNGQTVIVKKLHPDGTFEF